MINFFLIFILSIPLFSAELPRFIDWENAGLVNNITYKDTLFLSPNPLDDISDLLQSAIDENENTLIIIPNGQYTLSKTIGFKSNIGIKGEKADETIILIQTNNAFNISGRKNESITYSSVPETYSDTLISKTKLEIGDLIQMDIENGEWDTNPADWAVRTLGGQFGVIEVINDSTYLLDNKIKFNADNTLEIRKYTPKENVQISCLTLKRESQPSNVSYNISLNYAYNCKVENIISIKGDGAQVMLYNSFHCEVTNSYFNDSFEFTGSGTKGYGVTCASKTSYCKIEGNIFNKLRHSMMVKQGANSNVFAYNYSINPTRSEPISDFSGDISIHGHYPYYNLFESNDVGNIILDHYWGEAGHYNTFLRNRTNIYGLITTQSEVQSKNQNFIGNECINEVPFIDEYIVLGEGHLEIGNRIKSKFIQDTNGIFNYTSFIYPNKDAIIGPPNELNENKIDAQIRYENNQLTKCNEVLSVNNNRHSIEKVLFVSDIYGNSISFTKNNFSDVKKELKSGLFIIKTNIKTYKLYKYE